MSLAEFVKAQWTPLPIPLSAEDCRGRTYIVTGSNGGLGYECVKHLVRFEATRVIMAVRNMESGSAALQQIEAEVGRSGVMQVWELDLSSFDSVKRFAKKVEVDLDRVDGLVQNAGVAGGYWTEKEGMELNTTVNVVAPLLLTLLLLPFMSRAAKKLGITPRIALIGSSAAFDAKDNLKVLDRGNIFEDMKNRQKWESIRGAYPRSKLILTFAYRELARLVPVSQTGVIINLNNPGLCVTGLTRNTNWSAWVMVNIMRRLVGRTAEAGSRTLLYGLAAGEESHGRYLTECAVNDEALPSWVTDEDGETWAAEVWREAAVILQSVQPGCLNVLKV